MVLAERRPLKRQEKLRANHRERIEPTDGLFRTSAGILNIKPRQEDRMERLEGFGMQKPPQELAFPSVRNASLGNYSRGFEGTKSVGVNKRASRS